MNKKELHDGLLSELGSRLVSFGFGQKAKRQRFHRNTETGWACVHLAFIDHHDDFDATMDLAIRIDDVENLVNAGVERLSPKQKRETATLGVELGNLSAGEPRRWTIRSANDLAPVASSISEAYAQIGEIYLSKYIDMSAAYELLSDDARRGWMHSPVDGVRAQKVIALASLLDHDDLDEQIAQKRSFLRERNDFGLPDFESFADRLEERLKNSSDPRPSS